MKLPRILTFELQVGRPLPLRIIIWSLLLGVAAGFAVLAIHYSEVHGLADARLALLEGDFERAALIFGSLTDSQWNGEEAGMGLDLSTRLGPGTSSSGSVEVAGPDPVGIPYRLLLLQAIRERRFDACLRVAEYLGPGVEGVSVFEAAACLEMQSEKDTAAVVTPSGKLLDTWLTERINLYGRVRDAEAVIYDRWGRPLAAQQRDGDLTILDQAGAIFLTNSYVAEALPHSVAGGVRLSLDLELSRLAAAALDGYRGSIVIVSSLTGEVKTAVSDPVSRSRGRLPAFEQLREPASILKLLTSAAALRSQLNPDEQIAAMACEGAERYKGGILYCLCRSGPLSGLNQAMASSCNVAFANLGIMVGRQRMLEELGHHGFSRTTGSGMVFGSILAPEGNELQLAHLSIGLDATSITPVHAALLAASVANGGMMPEPRLVAGGDGRLGLSPRVLEPAGGNQAIDPDWIPMLLSSMEAVTKPGGTAYGISPPEFPLAVKTGTGRNRNMGFHTNYIGIGPMPDPTIAFCVRVTDQTTSRRVRRATRTVARRLFDGLAAKPYLIR